VKNSHLRTLARNLRKKKNVRPFAKANAPALGERKKARSITFHPETTLITGDNDTGKSSLLKSIFHGFGAEPPVHPDWKHAGVSVLLTFSVGDNTYSLLRQGSQFTLFSEDGNPIGVYRSVTNELGPYLARVFNFGLKLISRRDEAVTPPPAYFFLPFYFDQDRSWNETWRAFEKLDQMKAWKVDLLEYHTGIKPNEFYEMKGEQTVLLRQRDDTQAELEMVRRIQNELSDRLQRISFNVNLDTFREEITEMLVECEKIRQTAERIRERLVDLHNERMNLEAQIEIVKGSLKELNADYDFLRDQGEDVECPTCGAHYSNSFREVFEIALDEDRCEDLLVQLSDALADVRRKINVESAAHNKHEAEAARVNALLTSRREEVQLKDLIESESKQQVMDVLKGKLENLNNVVLEAQTRLDTVKRKLKELTSKERRDKINRQFRDLMRQYLFLLAVYAMPERSYRNVTARITEQGSDLPRALLAYRFAILQVMREHTSSVFAPIVIDSPIQQEQDKENHQRILEFIRDHRPKKSQLIIAVVDPKGIDLGGDVITLDDERNVLRSNDYDVVAQELEPFIQRSLFLMEGGLEL
jgi:hypothetical protein